LYRVAALDALGGLCYFNPYGYTMKLTGFLLLLSGWGIVLTALALLAAEAPRAGFVLAGVGVEALGLTLVARSHPRPRRVRG
jgi:hypothetical protein